MTSDGFRVLRAVEWSERMSRAAALPLKRIAVATLGGDADRAARVLASLDEEGWVTTDTMGWQSGWMTPKGRAAVTALADQ
jgi:hypothetical protein